MILSLILLGMSSAYRVMRTTDTLAQPDERWFQSGERRSHQTERNFRDEESFSKSRPIPQKSGFYRYSTQPRLTDRECMVVIKEEFTNGNYENPLEECAKVHSRIMRYLVSRNNY